MKAEGSTHKINKDDGYGLMILKLPKKVTIFLTVTFFLMPIVLPVDCYVVVINVERPERQ